MYADNEVDMSRSNLSAVVSGVREPACLLGGWAVYATVNRNFKAEQGRNYIGSRDIDLGFHVDETWSDRQLLESAFSKSVEILTGAGYYGVGPRLVQHRDLGTGRLLTEEESKKHPRYETFDLFVDPITDRPHPRARALLGFDPIDEPLLADVFSGSLFTVSERFGTKIMLPRPEVLASMKVNSVLGRNTGDKRIKDIADIYALAWYSGTKFSSLKRAIHEICDPGKISSTISKFADHDYDSVSRAIGIDKHEVSRVVAELAEA